MKIASKHDELASKWSIHACDVPQSAIHSLVDMAGHHSLSFIGASSHIMSSACLMSSARSH